MEKRSITFAFLSWQPDCKWQPMAKLLQDTVQYRFSYAMKLKAFENQDYL